MFIARQPIFNRLMKVYGYELLYRDSETATAFGNVAGNVATARVLGGLFELGISEITGGKKAFVNFDYDSLLSDSIELIEPNKLVIEVLEDIEIDDIIIARLIELKKKRYRIALDDFIADYKKYPIFPLANIIKYDLRATPLDTLKDEVEDAIRQGKIVLAEKVETQEEFEKAKEMGFNFFQGYFFKKPSIIGRPSDKKSIKLIYLKILSELNNPEPSYYEIAEIIEADVNLAYRLLRITKNRRIHDMFESIKRPLVYMGLKEIKNWINILMLQDLIADKPMELMCLSLVRSKFGALLAEHSKFISRVNEVSTMLLFSALDAILDLPMKEALNKISLTEDITEPLIEGSGELSPILHLVLAYEKGEWDKVKTLSLELEIEEEVYSYYLVALSYCKEITDAM